MFLETSGTFVVVPMSNKTPPSSSDLAILLEAIRRKPIFSVSSFPRPLAYGFKCKPVIFSFLAVFLGALFYVGEK